MAVERDEVKMRVAAIVPGLVVDREDISRVAVGEDLGKLPGKGNTLFAGRLNRKRDDETLTCAPFTLLGGCFAQVGLFAIS